MHREIKSISWLTRKVVHSSPVDHTWEKYFVIRDHVAHALAFVTLFLCDESQKGVSCKNGVTNNAHGNKFVIVICVL